MQRSRHTHTNGDQEDKLRVIQSFWAVEKNKTCPLLTFPVEDELKKKKLPKTNLTYNKISSKTFTHFLKSIRLQRITRNEKKKNY